MDNATIIEGEAQPVSQISLASVFRIPAVRQVMLLVGVAGAVAVGFAVVLWSQTPGYSQLYGDLDQQDSAQVVDALRAADFEYELNAKTGSVMVLESKLHDARLVLASQGLPKGGTTGMESLQEQSSFGQSQFRENALYQHALEAELARTISHLGSVRDARVHLALPKASAFIRDRQPASASVMLDMYIGRDLASDQAAAIVHLVASSVPNLNAHSITVIDQNGRLLSSAGKEWNDAATGDQFKISERLEKSYKSRIEDLLLPLLGPGRVRAEVVADMDFTVTEQTRESFDPERSALVSESVSNFQRSGGDLAAQGVPGALSNQPPVASNTNATQGPDGGTLSVNRDSNSSSTRNFEVDRTVVHTRPQTGAIRRLSVAVLVDDTPVAAGEGQVAKVLSDEDIRQFESLIKEAVGFDASRGDSVVVVKAAFQPVPEMPIQVEPRIWEKPIVIETLKMLLGAALVLSIAFGVVRPMLKSLMATSAETTTRIAGGGTVVLAGGGSYPRNSGAMAMPSYDEKVAAAKNISGHDPAKVAHIVKKWVGSSDA